MAQLINEKSIPSTRSELDLFYIPPTQVAVEKCQWNEVYLKNPVTNTGPYEFNIPPNPQFLQLSRNYLLMNIRIVDDKGVPIKEKIPNINATAGTKEAPKVAHINMLGTTLFKQVKLLLNGTEVYDSGANYAYKAYLETETGFGSDAKGTLLTAGGYATDELAGDYTVDNEGNVGFLKRRENYKDGGWVQLIAPIHIDLFAQDRYLINNIDLRLILYRNEDEFCLLCFDNPSPLFKLEVEAMRWYVKGVDTLKSINIGIEKTLMHHTAKYPVKRIEIKTIHVSGGRHETPENSLFSAAIPRRLLIGCVSATAYYGRYGKSPFNFQNFDVSEIFVTAGGISYPSRPLSPKYNENHFGRAYIQLFEALGLAGENSGNMITMDKFKNGWCLYGFNMSPTEDDVADWELVKNGATSVRIHFSKPIPDGGVEVIVYAEFDGLITIDQYRNTFTDYKA